MRTIGRWTLSGVLAVAAVGALSLAAAAQSRQLTFAYDQPKGSGYDAGADIFDKKLKELSNGALSINKYPGAQLGTEAQTMQKVQTGDIDFVFLSTANASTAQPESGVFSIHFIFRDENHAIKVLGDPKVIAAMHDLYAAKITGAHMLALLWQIFSGTGFPNHFFCDSWVVGFWRADHEEHIIGLGSRACTVVEAVPGQVRAQGTAADVSPLRDGADRPW